MHRSTFAYQPRPDHNAELAEQIGRLALRHPRYGYRRIHALLKREGKQRAEPPVNRKRVQRLWQQARLQVRKQPRKRRGGTGKRGAQTPPVKASYLGHVWTYDFLEDRTLKGTLLRILTVMDEFTREGLAIEVANSLPARRVIEVLARLVAEHGAPAHIRSDNGPEFIATELRIWLARQQVQTLYIDPGCPWQNGYEESFNGTVRDECLNMHLFASVAEARVLLEGFRHEYNEHRPHSSLGYCTPIEFKRAWSQDQAEAKQADSIILT
jgi:putative transposase